MLTLDKIYHAKFILKQVARKTDLIAAPRLCPGTDLYLKTENLQVTGSFKVRGAYYKISQLSEEERAKGVIACSAGNHAQGVALAATRMGIKSVVCMPDGAPIMKVESTKRLGAEVELVKGTYDDAHDRAVELQEQTGMTFIHPYDDELVIEGQGTIGLEILDQLPDVDAVIVPIGGGGLISGVAFAIKSLRPEVKVYGVQAAGAPSMEHAFHDHKYETLDSAVTFADGIAVKTPGETTFDMVSQYVDDIVTVSEDEIAAAILALMENQKLVAEGAGATPVAAALFGKLPLAGKKTVCLISGGNIDVNILSRVITRGLVMSGRKTNLMIALEDGHLVPVRYPDPQRLSELPGYEQEREKVIANTRALLEGRPANNVLLYGDAGTGKSSTVKAVANELAPDGLRLIEVKKNQLYQIPALMDELANNPLKFILFIDDLSFSANDDNFAALKAILEGGVGGRSHNVAVYATSNRRHLVKETMADRSGDDLHAADTRQELMSLAARFGLTVTFQQPDKDRYERILLELAKQYAIQMPSDQLYIKGAAFAIRAGGRSPRVAKQFVELLAAGVKV